jgi:membrane protease YdiL (CAAX protease family)
VVIGITEEVLWRGVYVTLFADNVWLNTIYPSLAFGLWHLCPLSVAQVGTQAVACGRW